MDSINLAPNINRAIFGLIESINDLTSILVKLGWWSLFWLVVFAVLFWYNNFVNDQKKPVKVRFDPNKAELLFIEGNISELLAYCADYAAQYPNDVWIHWYRGIGNFNLGHLVEAQQWFEKVVQINPNWKSDVEIYLSAIDGKINGISSNGPKH
jgi:tetratricopeptide (TPR) repeat protein